MNFKGFYFKFRFILRNHLAQKCIEEAEKENFLESKLLLKILENPFSDQPVENLLKEFNNEERKTIFIVILQNIK